MERYSIRGHSRCLCRGGRGSQGGGHFNPGHSIRSSRLPLILSTRDANMATPSLTGSLSSPLVTAMADTPVRFMDGAAFDFFLIEMVNTLRVSSAHAQARARKVEQEMIDTGLLPAPLPTPAMRKDHKDSTTSLASKATTKVDDEEEGLRLRLEAIGMHVGANITERYVYLSHSRTSHTVAYTFHRLCHGKPYFADTLESIKFVCKDLWTTCWDKQIDNLRTNHRVSLYLLFTS